MWTDPPPDTQSFALLVDDPDAPDPAAPTRIIVHWLLYNMAPTLRELAEHAGNNETSVAMDALNFRENPGYMGPCPPIGRHRYFFNLYALDAMLPDLGPAAHRADMEKAMEGHIIAQAVLMGTYQKTRG